MKPLLDVSFYQGKKVLITGDTGFKGSWLAEILLAFGADVAGMALSPSTTEPNLFTILKLESRITRFSVDIRNLEEVHSVFNEVRPEIVFHLAAQAIVRDSYIDPIQTHTTNIIGTSNILEVVRRVTTVKSVVVITTDKVYENKEWIYPYRETDALGGYDPYSASKAAADIVTSSYIQSFFNPKAFGTQHHTLIAIARAGNVIGGGDWAAHRLVPDIMRSVLRHNSDVVIRSPRAVRPWEHVLEPLSGYLLLGQQLYLGHTAISTSWNFGPETESFVTVEKVVQDTLAILEKGNLVVKEDCTKHEATLLNLDISKAKAYLGWRPSLGYKDTIYMTAHWYKLYYEGKVDMLEYTQSQIKTFFNS